MLRTEPKMKVCEGCGSLFMPRASFARACRMVCARKVVANDKKTEKKAFKDRKERAKPVSYWEKAAEKEFNRYVRLRDHAEGCISCRLGPHWDGQWHASHFRSVGAASGVRFNLWNVHKACSQCNHKKIGNIAEYRPRIIEKIGMEKLEWLEAQNKPVRYSVEYLKRLKAIFAKKSRRLEKRIR